MAVASFGIALYLRLGDEMMAMTAPYLGWGSGLFVLIFAAVAYGFTLHRGVWRYVSIRELFTIARVVVVSIVLFYLVLFVINRLEGVPRSVPFIHMMVLGASLAGTRIAYRAFRDRSVMQIAKESSAIPVLLVGYKLNAEQFIRDLQANPAALYRVVGIIDRDTGQHGRQVHGVSILGGVDDVEAVIEKLSAAGQRPQRVILSQDYLDHETVSALLDVCDAKGMTLSRLPRLTDFQRSMEEATTLKPIAIEDILGRAQNTHDRDGMRALIAGKTVLVTGAGGTIGGELSRQVAGFLPKQLVLLDASEYNLYTIDQEVRRLSSEIPVEMVLADVRDKAAVQHHMKRIKPDIVFHAAAIKHVPIAEANEEEAALTNVFGTRHVADAAQAEKVKTMVVISTDKAVNPTNVMGACKRLAEYYCQYAARNKPDVTRFVTVRFGNVLGSTGSVVPLFQKQLEAGGPLTVTHPDMERYFMTVREAVELVIQSAVLSQDMQQKDGFVFVLDMGKPVKISDMAKQMIRLAGLKPDEDIQISYTGLRPGEKLYEELFYDAEALANTEHAGIMQATVHAPATETLAEALERLYDACHARDAQSVRQLLQQLVPEFQSQAATDAA